ncbi:MAG: hypothetical protein IJC98_05585 [Clostridia bacterium]|nr:hypothetical protein [Clostridia bacterium]
MKELFVRARVYEKWTAQSVLTDTEDVSDGIVASVCTDANGIVCRCPQPYTDLLAVCNMMQSQERTLVLAVEAPMSGEEQESLLACVRNSGLLTRVLFVSRYAKMLDEIKHREWDARIVPIVSDDMVRPWIYAAYMGAEAIAMQSAHVLAEDMGHDGVMRAHNSNVKIMVLDAEDADTVRALVRCGCDMLLTEDPRLTRSLVW